MAASVYIYGFSYHQLFMPITVDILIIAPSLVELILLNMPIFKVIFCHVLYQWYAGIKQWHGQMNIFYFNILLNILIIKASCVLIRMNMVYLVLF